MGVREGVGDRCGLSPPGRLGAVPVDRLVLDDDEDVKVGVRVESLVMLTCGAEAEHCQDVITACERRGQRVETVEQPIDRRSIVHLLFGAHDTSP